MALSAQIGYIMPQK